MRNAEKIDVPSELVEEAKTYIGTWGLESIEEIVTCALREYLKFLRQRANRYGEKFAH